MDNKEMRMKKSPSRLEFFIKLIWVLAGILFLFVSAALIYQWLFSKPAAPEPVSLPTEVPSPAVINTPAPTADLLAIDTPFLKPVATSTADPQSAPTSSPVSELIDPAGARLVKQAAQLGLGTINQVVFSPDGLQVAVASSTGAHFFRLANSPTPQLLPDGGLDLQPGLFARRKVGGAVAAEWRDIHPGCGDRTATNPVEREN